MTDTTPPSPASTSNPSANTSPYDAGHASRETVRRFRSRTLEYRYSSATPGRTLLFLLDLKLGRTLWTLLIFLFKQSPAWMIPLAIGVAIQFLSDHAQQVDNPVYSTDALLVYAVVTLVLIAQNVPLHVYFVVLLSRQVRRMEQRLRQALVERLQQLSIHFHDSTETGRLQAKVLRDVEALQTMAMQFGEFMPMSLSTILFAIGYTAWVEPIVLLFFVVAVPLCVGLVHVFRGVIRTSNREFRTEVESMSANVSDMLSMIPVARAHGVEGHAVENVRSDLEKVGWYGRKLDRINATFQSSSWVVMQLSLLATLTFSGYLCYRGHLDVGRVVTFNFLFQMIIGSLQQIIGIYPQMQKGIESIRSLGEVLECPDIEQNEGRRVIDAVKGEIEFDHVTFHYPNTRDPALKDFSLHIQPGECVAFVGASGSGKSTLMNLTIGFRRPNDGRIRLDGIDMADLDMRSYRAQISVVPQQTLLFSGTIRDNILYGISHVEEATLREMVELSNVAEFVDALPEGLETRVGEGGARLSGGQRQRIAIARAMVRDPSVIILDEATSALDTISEKLVQEALDRLVHGRTTLIVAHRLSTIRNADRIAVLDKGRLVELGTHEELMDQQGAFHRLKSLQT